MDRDGGENRGNQKKRRRTAYANKKKRSARGRTVQFSRRVLGKRIMP